MKKKIQKPFDAEAAKRGARVETRDGMTVRIICYDKVDGIYPIIALVNQDGYETCNGYTSDGKLFCHGSGKHDLVIVEEVEEAKFNLGDWVVASNNNDPRLITILAPKDPQLITIVAPNRYELQDLKGHRLSIPRNTVENLCGLWTIKYAKPGDVLIQEDGKYPFIFQKYKGSAIFAYCGLSITDSILTDDGRPWTNDPMRPATYKERQQFLKKMGEEGYRWDTESLTPLKIKIHERWSDDEKALVRGYFIEGSSSRILPCSGDNYGINYNVFATEELAKSALAMARISQLIANDTRYGGPVTDEEWLNNGFKKFTIRRINSRVVFNTSTFVYNFLAFHTEEQRQLFWEENESLIKDYLRVKDNYTLEE